MTDVVQTPGKVDVWNQPRDIEAVYPSETDIDQTPSRADCSQRLSSDFDAPDSSVTEIEQTYNKYDAFNLLKSYLGVSSDDEIPNSKSDYFNFLLNSVFDASDFSAADVDHTLCKA
ncbi:hypothetical protein AVEN_258527-1 [Araneus ventricosus]|uniref:Uncharacterized protein n=1 Tax=Araneus ventricosus TaxID=182803 RepID=A0A4Y2I576_ARAVE|nr:hypothetical protein AVEN_258527-1 [Araneus ventricosus]